MPEHRSMKWRRNNPEKYEAYSKKYRQENKEYFKKYAQDHREETKKRMKIYRKANPDKLRKYHRKNRYNITQDQYDEILLRQEGVCAICLKPETAKVGEEIKPLAVDHNHETGKIRGLLCQKCNHGIGNFKDSLILLENAKKYIKNYE